MTGYAETNLNSDINTSYLINQLVILNNRFRHETNLYIYLHDNSIPNSKIKIPKIGVINDWHSERK